jgi:hypothetical protein
MKQRYKAKEGLGVEFILASSEEERDYISSIQEDIFEIDPVNNDLELKDDLLSLSLDTIDSDSREMISLAGKGVEHYLRLLGSDKEVDTEIIHLLSWDCLSDFEESTEDEAFHCRFITFPDAIFLERALSDTLFCLSVFQELWESLTYSSVYMVEDGLDQVLCYQSGFTVPDNRVEKYLYFGWDSLLTKYQCRRFYQEFLEKNAFFKEDIALYGEDEILRTIIGDSEKLLPIIDKIKEVSFLEDSGIFNTFLLGQIRGEFKESRRLCNLAYGKRGFQHLGRMTSTPIN